METTETFNSAGLKLAGLFGNPARRQPDIRRPAFIILHGFGSNKGAGNVKSPAEILSGLGYLTFRFDMRGCGESEGERGRIICLEQVEDTQNAISYLSGRPEVDPHKIALLGSSFGAAVALFTAAKDERVAAIVSSGGWGNGERKFRGQHPTEKAWKKFTGMLEEGKKIRRETGKSPMVNRYDIVPIPEHLRNNVVSHSIQEFPVETAQSMFDFKAEDVVENIAPRPLLLLHSAVDSVTPTEQSIELFKRAGQPADLHLFAETDHFMFSEENGRVRTVLIDWLHNFFPLPDKP